MALTESAIFRMAEGSWLSRGRGIRTLNLVTRRGGGQSFLSGITEFEPGATIPMHYHNCEESVVVLEGIGTFEASGRLVDLQPFDATWIRPRIPHRFLNRSTGVLRIQWIYGDPNATRTLVSTGVEIQVGDAADVYTNVEAPPPK